MLNNIKRALILAPHTDDGELGAGGTISRLIEQGCQVWYAAFSTAEDSLPAELPKDTLKIEVQRATNVLGIKSENLIIKNYNVRRLNYHRQEILEDLVKLKRAIEPDLVLMPSPRDLHQDHTTISTEGLRAFKTTTILGYELIWNNLDFQSTCFIKLEPHHVSAKCLALKEYKSQSGRSYMGPEFITSLARVRGIQIGADFAECFEVIRWVI